MSIKHIAGALSLSLALGVAACGGDDSSSSDAGDNQSKPASGSSATKTEGPVKIAFSAPGADHGWMAAITENARDEAEKLGDVELQAAEGVTDSAAQADQVETLLAGKPDALVILPNEPDALMPVAQKAMAAGIPVIDVDREFTEQGAFRSLITGDNYGIGYQAGNYFADELKCSGNVVEIQGIAGIPVTEQRSQGFRDALKRKCQDGVKIVASQPADFVPDKGLSVMENILQAQKQIDAVYTHDDDMAEGVVSAIQNAGREDEMFLTGAGGSKAAMDQIKEGGLYRATFLYNPSMSASAIRMARKIVRGEGFEDLTEPEVPQKITVPATTVTKENVDDMQELREGVPGRARAAGRRLRRPARRGPLPARPQRRRQVDADQVRLRRRGAHARRDPRRRRAAAGRRPVGIAQARRRDDLPGARPRRGPDRRPERLPRPRAAPRAAAGPRGDEARDGQAARAPRPREHPARRPRPRAAPRRAAGRLDRPRAVARHRGC